MRKSNARHLNAVVTSYIAHHRDRARYELRHYASQPSLTDAIREAALSRIPSETSSRIVRHPHQRRLPLRVLQRAEERLQAAAPTLRRAGSFEQLHELVEQAINPIPGIGALAVYDIAHRIGAYLRLRPRAVYLHAGARDGARALKLSGRRIDRSAFLPAFRKLTAAEIENCLCIYKDHLRDARLGLAGSSGCVVRHTLC